MQKDEDFEMPQTFIKIKQPENIIPENGQTLLRKR